MTLEQRIRKLERANHVWRLFSTALLVLILVVFAVGAARRTGRDVLKGKKLIIQDDKGRDRAVIKVGKLYPKMAWSEDVAMLTLYGPDGSRSRATLHAGDREAGCKAWCSQDSGTTGVEEGSLDVAASGGSCTLGLWGRRRRKRAKPGAEDPTCHASLMIGQGAPQKDGAPPTAVLSLSTPGKPSASLSVSRDISRLKVEAAAGALSLVADEPALWVCDKDSRIRAILGRSHRVLLDDGRKAEMSDILIPSKLVVTKGVLATMTPPSALTLLDPNGCVVHSVSPEKDQVVGRRAKQ